MNELALIMVSAILVNNFVLVQFLGLCPFMGVSKKIETAIGLSLATTFVLTLAAMCSYLIQQYVLKPLDLEFLRTISFILVIAVRSEEHTSELQSLMRNSYAVFCLKKKNTH